MIDLRLIAYTPNGARLGPLPTPLNVQASFVLNDVGALSFSYAPDAARSELLGQPIEVGAEVSTDGGNTWMEPDGGRFLYLRDGRDPVKTDDAYTIEAPSYMWRLQKALVGTAGLNAEGRREYVSQTPGAILSDLLDRAWGRGAASGIQATWSAANDTSGSPWPETHSISYEPGANLLAVVQAMVEAGWVDVRTRGRVMDLYAAENPNGLARDRTTIANPVSLRYGRDLTEAPFRRTWEGLADTAVVVGDGGVAVTRINPGAAKPWGVQETYVSASGVEDEGTLAVLGDANLELTAVERVEYTFGLEFGAAAHLPLRDYQTGDWVLAASTSGGAPSRVRVRQLTLTRDERGSVGGNVVLNDRFLEADVLQARRISRITAGATQGGTGGTPGGIGPDILAPDTAEGLTASSASYVNPDGFVRSQISLNWNDVTQNADNTPTDDVDHYEVWARIPTQFDWRMEAVAEVSSWANSPYDPGQTWEFRVRAVDTSGNVGGFSAVASTTTAFDNTAPPPPSAPTGTSRLGTARITWDGLNNVGAAMTATTDWRYVEAHVSTVNNFTPSATTRVGELVGPGYVVAGPLDYGTPYYVRLVAVDSSGNASEPSAQLTINVAPLVDVSNFPDDAMTELYARTGKFLDLSADNFAANLIEGAWIKAGAITADKLTIGAAGFSVLPNSYMEDQWVEPSGALLDRPASWGVIYNNGGAPVFSWETATPIGGSKSLLLSIPSSARGSTVGMTGVPFLPVTAGTKWYVRAKVRPSRTMPGRPTVLRFHTSTGTTTPWGLFDPDAAWNVAAQIDPEAGTTQTLEGVVTVPADHTLAAVSLAPPDTVGAFLDSAAERTTTRFLSWDTKTPFQAAGAVDGEPVTVSLEIRTDTPTTIKVYPYQSSGLSIAGSKDCATTSAYQTFTFDTTVKDWGAQAGMSTGELAVYDSSDAGGTVYVQNVTITPAANLVVDNVEAFPAATDAQITDIGAGKIKTGILQATERIIAGSMTGARAEMNGVGFQSFASDGRKMFEVQANSGETVIGDAAGVHIRMGAFANIWNSNISQALIRFGSANSGWSDGQIHSQYFAEDGYNVAALRITSPYETSAGFSRAPFLDLRQNAIGASKMYLKAEEANFTANTYIFGDSGITSSIDFRSLQSTSSSDVGFQFSDFSQVSRLRMIPQSGYFTLRSANDSGATQQLRLQGSQVAFSAGGVEVYYETTADIPGFSHYGRNLRWGFGGSEFLAINYNADGYRAVFASAFTVNSDRDRKKNQEPATGALDALRAVGVYDYDMEGLSPREHTKGHHDGQGPHPAAALNRGRGLMYDEVRAVLPDAVTTDAMGSGMVSLYDVLATAVAAIKELDAEVATLKATQSPRRK